MFLITQEGNAKVNLLESFNMEKMDYITQKKQTYFQVLNEFCYCSGAKVTCSDLLNDGYSLIDWDAQATDLPIQKIKLLDLSPTKQQLKKAILPKFISELSSLEHLVFNINFLQNMEAGKLPTSLRSLLLTRNLEYADLLKELVKNKIGWDKTICLENLEALMIIADEEKDKITNSISQVNFPKLTFLGFGFSNKDELSIFNRFTTLSDLELTHLRDYPIFDHIKHLPIFSLNITGSSNKFELKGIELLQTLELVRLNGIKSEIDCMLFTKLPNLKELVVSNSKLIKNIEKLMDCKHLKSIKFLNCGNPFKGVAQKFHDRSFEKLEIKFA